MNVNSEEELNQLRSLITRLQEQNKLDMSICRSQQDWLNGRDSAYTQVLREIDVTFQKVGVRQEVA